MRGRQGIRFEADERDTFYGRACVRLSLRVCLAMLFVSLGLSLFAIIRASLTRCSAHLCLPGCMAAWLHGCMHRPDATHVIETTLVQDTRKSPGALEVSYCPLGALSRQTVPLGGADTNWRMPCSSRVEFR